MRMVFGASRLAVVALLLGACASTNTGATGAGNTTPDGAPPAPETGGDAATPLRCSLEGRLVTPSVDLAQGDVLARTTVKIGDKDREVQLLRLPTADGRSTFAEWIPPVDAGRGPAMVVTAPYDGIDWTGLDVDARWAAQCPSGSCLLPDRDSPGGGADAGVIAYRKKTPEEFASLDAVVWAFSGMGVLGVYSRFYTGGSWWQYAQDAVAALRFLSTRDNVDPARVGIYGGSLGGFESFYGAAYAPPEIAPKVIVAMYPPVDLAREMTWAVVEAPEAARTAARKEAFKAFFDPYVRRALVDTGALPSAGGDFSCFDPPSLAARVQGDVLVVQDDWDLLVPPKLARSLVDLLGSKAHTLWYTHTTPPDVDALPVDHGPFDEVTGLTTRLTFVVAFAGERLGLTTQFLVPYQEETLQALVTRMRDHARAGIAQPGAGDRLADLADPRVVLFDVASSKSKAGAEWIAQALQALWGVTMTPANAQSYLRTNGLPP